MSEKIPITVLILTLNEEYHLPGILDNIQDWAQDVFIVDSLSTDRTIDIALERGVKVVQRRFTDFADQWNFALSLPVETPWSMKMDPDERLSDELKQNIAQGILHKEAAGFSFDRRLWFLGKPLSIKQEVLRVWEHGKCHFPKVIVNEHPEVDGKIKHLPGLMEHFDSCGMLDWVAKQNRYSTMEAITYCEKSSLNVTPNLFGTSLQRAAFFKKYFWKIPLRYQLMFLYLYFWKGAWRQGQVGRDWINARIIYVRLIEMKIHEIQYSKIIPEIPKGACGVFDPRIVHSDLQKQVHPVL